MPNSRLNNKINVAKIARETMIEEGFKPDIPEAVDREVHLLDQQTILQSASPRDLRDLLWSSIDNVTSLDLDQVEYAEKQHDNSIRVLIGIADVAAFVPKGSATDFYSLENTTSVYTGVKTFPMLPEELSTNKTSLLQGQDRLAIVIEIVVGPGGIVETRDVFEALVHNHSKLSYEIIGRWLDRDGDIPQEVSAVDELASQIRLQLEVSKRLNEVRKQNGTLRLETNQASPVLDDHERIVDLAIDERNSARDIIESFMVTANSAMAEFLERKGITGLRRVVRSPDNWPRIVEIARELNETLPLDPDPRALSNFLERRRKVDPDHFPDLSLAVVKLLGPGDYVVHVPGQEGEGHFGLAVHRYTHSTAPNRRYADLITQRLLKACIAERSSDYNEEELSSIAEHCNERESAARKVERKMRKVVAALFMDDRVGEKFEAIVTGVTIKGTFARIVRPPVDGKVVKGLDGLKVGQKIRVKLLSTDPENGFIDFAASS
jgi:exoribonuclease II